MARSRAKRWLSGWPGLLIGPVLVVVGAAGALLLDGDTGVRPFYALVQEEARIGQEIRELEVRRAALEEQARLLRDDPVEVEAVARETLGMARPGETVIRLPEVN